MYYTKVSIIFESIYYESTTTTVRVLPADVPSYFPKVRMYNYFISYENTFESNVVHLYSVHIPSYNLLYFRIPSHLVLIRLVVMARAGGWLYPTNLDGTPGDDVEAPFVTRGICFKPRSRSRLPISPTRTSPSWPTAEAPEALIVHVLPEVHCCTKVLKYFRKYLRSYTLLLPEHVQYT